MEPITFFAASVGLIGGCKLVFSAAQLLGKGIYSEGRQPVQRDDWYCFFRTSDLLGVQGDQNTVLTQRQQQENRRRQQQQQQRPRLQA